MSYRYTPSDIAKFLISGDFRLSDERRIINEIWYLRRDVLSIGYMQDKESFRRAVYNEIMRYEISDELDDINDILEEMGSKFIIKDAADEQDAVTHYLKNIKLHLTYKTTYKRIKLRSLIKMFGYERRSQQLLKNINQGLDVLGIKTYVNGNILSDIAQISLDDIIMFRLE